MNKSVMKCCICNNESIGQFITINNKKYHLCCIEQLQQENKILRENAEHNDKVVDKVNWENMLLKKENQELKSQLKGTTHCYDEEEHRKLQENYDRIYAENCKLREEHNINDISLLDENYRLKKGIDKAMNILKDNFVYDYVRSCDTTDGVGYDEIDTEHFTYRVYELLKEVSE